MLSSEIFFLTILNSSSFFPVSSSPFLLPASNCFFKYLEKEMLAKLDQSPSLPTFKATWWFPCPSGLRPPFCWRPRSSQTSLFSDSCQSWPIIHALNLKSLCLKKKNLFPALLDVIGFFSDVSINSDFWKELTKNVMGLNECSSPKETEKMKTWKRIRHSPP